MTPDEAGASLSAVIVTYNSAGVVGGALTALADVPGVELVVVDNASTDDSVETVRRMWPDATVLENAANEGFARAVNAGVRASTGELVMLLNPDAEVGADAVRSLRAAAADHPGDVVAPLIRQPAPQRILSAGRMPTVWRMFTHYSGLSRFASRMPVLEGHYLLPRHVRGITPVEWVTGACFVVPRRVWDEVGGLTERWFMYAEDVEFGLKVSRAGHRSWLIPHAVAEHLVGKSDSSASDRINAAWVLNLRDFYSTDLAPVRSSVIAWTAVVAVGLAARGLVAAMRHGPASPSARRLRGYSAALLRGGR